jgi:hypothetical protein
MATYNASDLLTKSRHLGQYGELNVASGKVTPSSAVVTADILNLCIIPAGTEVCALLLAWSTFGTTAPADVGYAPVNTNDGSLAASAAYFKAAEAFQTANADGKVFAGFDPIKFEQDVYLRLTFGTVSAGAAGTIRGNALGRNVGIK